MTVADQFMAALSGVNLKAVSLHHARLITYALNQHGRPVLLVRVPREFDGYAEGTREIEVKLDSEKAASRFLRFESEVEGYSPLFGAVVESLLEVAAGAASEPEALQVLLDHFAAFRRMFSARSGRMNESAIRGFCAELFMLLELKQSNFTPMSAVQAWQGPYRTSKDFILSTNRSIEVKSIRRLNRWVTISSVDQLEPRNDELRLAVLPLTQVPKGEGTSTSDLVSEVRHWMTTDSAAGVAFDTALRALGFDASDSWYDGWAFEAGPWSWFDVAPDFPRIKPDVVPPGVATVRYALDIDSLGAFATQPFWHSDLT